MQTIRNPIEWSRDQLGKASGYVGATAGALKGTETVGPDNLPIVHRIFLDDLREALRKGINDLAASRSDILFICLVYPLVGLFLAWSMFGYDMLHMIFPAASGFALIGPVTAVFLYDMSKRREQGETPGWAHAIGIVNSPSFGPILVLSLGLFAVFGLWMVAAHAIYAATLGPEPPASIGAFINEVLFTSAGWTMIVGGCAVGFIFAVVVLAVSVISFPLLVDHDVGLRVAVVTSVKVALRNPKTILAWGAIVAAGLVLGTIPLFLGLIFVLPALGHATWHLYRRSVEFLPA